MPKVALLFPGQGAQFVGMGQGLIGRSPSARELFERASEILGFNLVELCIQGPDTQLNLTSYSQPALFVHAISALRDFSQQHPEVMADVVAVAGLSLGEYSALCAAEAITFEDGVRLVQQRGAAMQDAASSVASGMASILTAEREQVEAICDAARQPGEVLQVANLLCPGNIAISGQSASLDAAEVKAAELGARFIRLSVAGAFHTSIMQPALTRLTEAVARTPFANPKYPVYTNVDAAAHNNPTEFASLLTKQVVSPVLWEATLRNLIRDGVEQFYEIGAGRVLAGTLKRIDRKIPCECFGD